MHGYTTRCLLYTTEESSPWFTSCWHHCSESIHSQTGRKTRHAALTTFCPALPLLPSLPGTLLKRSFGGGGATRPPFLDCLPYPHHIAIAAGATALLCLHSLLSLRLFCRTLALQPAPWQDVHIPASVPNTVASPPASCRTGISAWFVPLVTLCLPSRGLLRTPFKDRLWQA